MKLLVIGIDGGDRRIIEGMPMPFLSGELEKATNIPAEEDLYSRGWAKILSGLPGAKTGAFYTKPKPQDLGCEATQSFRSTDYANAGAEPLWEALNKAGLRVGFMNVPTTYPAPEVDGFFVAGAGGGLGQGDISDSACYPHRVGEVLAQEGYIFDTRYIASGIRELSEFLKRLRTMTEHRVNTFLRLQEQYQTDVGFVAFMGPRALQYVAMQDIQHVLASRERGLELNEEQKAISDLYKHFDAEVKRLVEATDPESVILVSDHSQAPYKYQAEVGAFLKGHGWQVDRPKVGNSFRKTARQVGKAVLPAAMVKKLSGNPTARAVAGPPCPVDFRRSQAFGMRYVSGIYVNDERFNGPVEGTTAREKLIEQIMEAFNSDPVALEYGLSAVPYRSVVDASPAVRDDLPDVWINCPDTVFFEYGIGSSGESPGRLITPNSVFGQPIDWPNVTRDQWTGIKGRHALLAFSGREDLPLTTALAGDLTDAYSVTLTLATA